MIDNTKFIELLNAAKGERTQNQFALHCGIGSSTITRFIKGERKPTPAVLKKIASKAYNGVTYEELMQAAGYLDEVQIYAPCNPDLKENRQAADLPIPKERSEIMELIEHDDYFKQFANLYKLMTEVQKGIFLSYVITTLKKAGINTVPYIGY